MYRRKQTVSKELTLEQMQAERTTIYDCSVDLRIEIPREKDINIDSIYKITLISIAHEMASKHPECRLLELIYLILKKTVSATKRNFRIVKKKKTRLALERKLQNAGHLREICQGNRAIYETISYSGQVEDDCNGQGPITVDCTVKLFLSPGQ